MIPRELIDRYFRNECSDDEKRRVLEYLRNHPGEWNRYMTEEDWDSFEVRGEVDPALSEKMFKTVSSTVFRKSRKRQRSWLAAALVAGLAIALWWMYRPGPKPLAAAEERLGPDRRMAEKRNFSRVPLSVILGDSSEVILSPNSSIRFYEPFMAEEGRTVYLSGEAQFHVAADKDRPFNVYADKLVTTVLGTSFTVKAFAENDVITLKLHTGKVQAAAIDSMHSKWKDKVVLLPGDELIYNKSTMLADLKRSVPAERLLKAGPAGNKIHTVHRPDWYTFETSLLSEVFDQLSSYYQVDIYYYPSDLQNKYFSGRLHKTDSLETILKDIALLNHLIIEKKERSYIIKKKN